MQSLACRQLRLSACAIAVFSLFSQQAAAAPANPFLLTADVTAADYVIGSPGVTTPVVLAPAAGSGIIFNGNALLVDTSTTLVVGSTRSTVTNVFNANGGTLAFTLAPNAIAGSPAFYAISNFDVKNGSGSGKLSVDSLVMSGVEKVALTFSGSLKNGASYALINSRLPVIGSLIPYKQTETSAGVSDNSYVINSSVAVDSQLLGNNLVFTASRADNEYILKSGTAGHFSNPAALTLGTIAAQGLQQGDLINAINRIDIDSYGFGNNKANLAVQMKRLAPIANNALVLTALASTDPLRAQVDDRLASLRGEVPGMKAPANQSVWVNGYTTSGRQAGVDNYDGYRATTGGIALGFDHAMSGGSIGLAFSAGHSMVEQQGFRLGDRSNLDYYQASIYGSSEFGRLYLDGALSAMRYDVEGNRATAIDRIAASSYTMTSTSFKTSLGYRIKFQDGKSVMTPMLGLESVSLRQPSYTETGAGDLGLLFDQKNYQRLRSKVGLRFNTEGRLGNTASYTALYMAFNHDSGLNNMNIRSSYSGTTDPLRTGFTTTAADLQRTMVQVGAGLTLAISKQSSLQLRYDLEHRQAFNSHTVQFNGVWKF